MNRGRLIVVSGPSGTGKGTICRELVQKHPEIALSVSWTDRDIRPGEAEGVTYFYKAKEEYDGLIAQGGFLEYAGIYGGRYGTPRPFVDENVQNGRDVVLEIETKGARQVMALKEYDVISIFILPPSMKELKRRLLQRGRENIEKAEKRFRSAYLEIDLAKEYDFVLVNDDLQEAVSAIKRIIDAGKYLPRMNDSFMELLKEETQA